MCSDLIGLHRDSDGDVGQSSSRLWLVASSSRIFGIQVLLPVRSPFPAADTGFSHIPPTSPQPGVPVLVAICEVCHS